jgi:hypothetical protein
MALKSSPRLNSAGHTDEEKVQTGDLQVPEGFLDHVAVQMAGATGVDLDHWSAGPADPFGVVSGLDIPFDHPNPEITL